MWKDINNDFVGNIEKLSAEFQVWMVNVLPYAKMKVRVYENQYGKYVGYSDVRIIRKFDNTPEGAVGYGDSVDIALENTINCFVQIVKEDYPNGLVENDIEYAEWSDF